MDRLSELQQMDSKCKQKNPQTKGHNCGKKLYRDKQQIGDQVSDSNLCDRSSEYPTETLRKLMQKMYMV